MQRDEKTFAGVLEYLIREYNIDTSSVPDIHEAVKQRREYHASHPVVDTRALQLEKLRQAISMVREEVDPEKYRKMVFCFQILKYVTPDEKFKEEFTKVRDGVLRTLKG